MQSHTDSNDQYAYVLYPGIDQTHFNQKYNDVSIIKQENQLHVVKDNVNHVWGIVNYNNETKTLEIEGTKIEIKAKGMFIIKKKDNHSFEGTYRNPELSKNVLDIQSIIKIEGYNTVNKSNADIDTHFELRK
ncbi:Hyaluronate lyase precursor [Staphylococcus agnetis]|nr:Hyaluronate lyase precursor [Staphylococcus agnetis]